MEITGEPQGDLTRERQLRNVSLQKIIRSRKTLRKRAKWWEIFVRFKKNLIKFCRIGEEIVWNFKEHLVQF